MIAGSLVRINNEIMETRNGMATGYRHDLTTPPCNAQFAYAIAGYAALPDMRPDATR